MKVAILAGGYGTRISEETEFKPKPMIEIGGKPILWHIMKYYSSYGFNEFVILLGYKGYYIKEYFANYFLHNSDVTVDTGTGNLEFHNSQAEDWKITLVDTGLNTMTGGRVLRAKKYLEGDTFMLTYGDGLADLNLKELLTFHKSHKRLMTLTSVQPDGRFGALEFSEDRITHFLEKPQGDGAWINGGFFVCEPKVFDYLKQGDSTVLERQPLEELAGTGQLMGFRHSGFWKCMDTLRDKNQFQQMWDEGQVPWIS